jgi:hypothetical protein
MPSWAHGTRIGMGESSDLGTTWHYRGTADIPVGESDFSHWAPEIVAHEVIFHMFLTFVPGMPSWFRLSWQVGLRLIVRLFTASRLHESS